MNFDRDLSDAYDPIRLLRHDDTRIGEIVAADRQLDLPPKADIADIASILFGLCKNLSILPGPCLCIRRGIQVVFSSPDRGIERLMGRKDVKRLLIILVMVTAQMGFLATDAHAQIPPGLAKKPYGLPPGIAKKMWRTGERLSAVYFTPRYFIDPLMYNLAPPHPGHRWVGIDGDAYLVHITSALIANVIVGGLAQPTGRYSNSYGTSSVELLTPEDRWRSRYGATQTYDDDPFYQQCRYTYDPTGIAGGALIGGVLGNTIASGRGRTGATLAGIVIGGAVGAALTRDLTCEDRSYAYRAYSDGLNSGSPNSEYQWRNPETGNHGTFQVGDYNNDPDGFRCTTYTQQIFVDGRPQTASGRACQQPDGTWTIVS
ncbi:MAG: RcnB family protein [Proteobacteria bacterium]|nr:RcnB family protein [Pseudomonadota bacterium]